MMPSDSTSNLTESEKAREGLITLDQVSVDEDDTDFQHILHVSAHRTSSP